MDALRTNSTAAARRLLAAIGLLILALALMPANALAGTPTVAVFDSLTTLRSDRALPPGGQASAEINAAGNEFESFQVSVEAGSSPIAGLRVDPGQTLRNAAGATIPASNLTIYREVDYAVGQPSDNEGQSGPWPDALIPERDYFYGEDRSAFPADLGPGQRLVAWVDVLVSDSAPSGTYSGSILVSSDDGTVAEIPVELTVHGFTLPSTSSLQSSFAADPGQLCAAHFGNYGCNSSDPNAWKLHALYVRAGLENRITIPNGFLRPSSGTTRTLFAQHAAPLIQGTDPSMRLHGAKLTALSASPWCIKASNGCLQNWKDAASQYGFGSRFFAYVCDEPSADASVWPECASTADRADQIWPGVRKLVTTSIQDAEGNGGGSSGALRYTDLLTPVINNMVGSGQSQRPAYNGYLDPSNNAPGTASNELWLYASCMSHSCNTSEDPQGTASRWAGWPGYAIDAPASQARAMAWMAFQYRAKGELYWDTTNSLPHAWTDQYVAGGNGDGNLFYPGRASGGGDGPAIGGSHDIPIESIRMKRIRDGREDYEYLQLLAQRNQAGDAMNVIDGLFGSEAVAARNTTVGSGALSASRSRLADLIAPAGGPPAQRTLKVSVSGAGSVRGPGIDCPGDCSESFSEGAVVSLHASGAGGSKFAGWSGSCGGLGGCQVSLSTDKSVGAAFDKKVAPADKTPPEATITAGPSRATKDRTPRFDFTSSEPGSTFQCRLDRGRWYSCAPRKSLKRLTYGSHTFAVRAADMAGNWDPTPQGRSFKVLRRSAVAGRSARG